MSYYRRGNYRMSNDAYGHSRAPYSNNYRNARRSVYPTMVKKRSACTVSKDFRAKSGKVLDLFVKGWKYTKNAGLVSFVACPASSKYQKGKNHITCVARVKSAMGVSTVWCYWNPAKQILSIPDLRLVASGKDNYVSYLMPKKFK